MFIDNDKSRTPVRRTFHIVFTLALALVSSASVIALVPLGSAL